MIEFASEPDPIFLAIVNEALRNTAEELYPFRHDYQPIESDLSELDQNYELCYSGLARLFTRDQARTVIERLQTALHETISYRLTDFHWLIMYRCLEVFCDLHNDGALGQDGQVGPYIIDKIDLGAIADVFFFDTDFLFGAELFVARERNPDRVPDVTVQAAKIAAGVKPDAEDLELVPIEVPDWEPLGDKRVPKFGYIGPYPMREREDPADRG
jgi:hypothetical protein